MSGYKQLQVYQRGYAAAKRVYRMTERYPKEERYGITDQMRRASVSIALNIAEGYARRESQQEFKRFLMMAMGSSNEMIVLLDFSKDLGYIDAQTHAKASQEYDEISRMLNELIQRTSEHI